MRAALLFAIAAAGCGRAGAHESAGNGATAASAGATSSEALLDAGASAPAATSSTTNGTDSSADGGPQATSNAADAGADAASTPPGVAWARKLAPLLFRDVNTLADVTMRLYKDDGTLDDGAAAEVERVLWSSKDEAPPHVSRRLLQLVVKAAEHFGAHEVQVISSHRSKARKGSRHRSGEAIDFVFPGVPPKKLAELLRTYPRVGVGEYVHPRSQFVHLDVREQSYHWIDGSPPRRVWREHPLPDPTAQARDAAYTPSQDLPDDAT